MIFVKELVKAQKRVLRKPSYKALFVILFFVTAYFFILLTSIPGQTIESWVYSVSTTTILFVLVGSFLASLIMTTQAYVVRNYGFMKVKHETSAGLIGSIVSGLIATACCSPFLVGFLGLTSVAFFVALNQTYFFTLAILVMLISLYFSSKVVFCEECQVKIGAKER